MLNFSLGEIRLEQGYISLHPKMRPSVMYLRFNSFGTAGRSSIKLGTINYLPGVSVMRECVTS